jgi:hypothetical protein
MAIKPDGKIGIGTTSPTALLNLHNSTAGDGDGARATDIRFSGLRSGGETHVLAAISASHSGTSDDNRGRLDFFTTETSSGLRRVMRLENIYSGYTWPFITIGDIDGGAEYGYSTLNMRTGVSGGAVGPSMKFYSKSGTGAGIFYENIDNTNQKWYVGVPYSGAGTFQIGAHPGTPHYNSTGGAVMTFVSGSGNVGIGTTSPERPLEVNGIIKASTALIGEWGAGGYGAGLYTDVGNIILYFDNSGNSRRWDNDNIIKSFIIDHPTDVDKFLIHGTLEGPEGGVYYRGTASLNEGQVEIKLPDYFEALTRKEGRTIILTNIDGFDILAVKKINNQKINNGIFIVFSDNTDSNQELDWEVKAIRKDAPPLVVEPNKKDINVRGEGPYKYTIK